MTERAGWLNGAWMLMIALVLLGWAVPGQIDRVLADESRSLIDAVGRSSAQGIGRQTDLIYRTLCAGEPLFSPENALGRLLRQLLLRGTEIVLTAPLWLSLGLGLWLDAKISSAQFSQSPRLAHPERYPRAYRLFQGSLMAGLLLLLGPIPLGPDRLFAVLAGIGIAAWNLANQNAFHGEIVSYE